MASTSNTPVEEQEEPPIKAFSCTNVNAPVGLKSRHHSTLRGFKISTKYQKLMNEKLKGWDNMSLKERELKNKVENILDQSVNEQNYQNFFKYLLWLEESAAFVGLQRYNMFKVRIKFLRGNLVEVDVPGLAEKRPSVLPGDVISLRMHEDHTAYQGIVDAVNDKSIYIKYLNDELFLILAEYPKVLWDVKFEFSRLQLVRMHEGVAAAGRKMLKTLFPEKPMIKVVKKSNITQSNLYNPGINKEQLIAVDNIVNCSSQHAPYVLFGPPGTGKTITMVEAILQTLNVNPGKNILVCAPSNTACDNLAVKLYEYCTEVNGLLRIHAKSRDPSLIPDKIKPCSNLEGTLFKEIKGKELCKYRIIVSTLHLIGKFRDGYHPHYLFIDEAAQATEPECDIAISLMSRGSFIVLAGDPEQLGPVCESTLAEKKGLGQSLMERLMYKNMLYQETREGFDNNFITMLVRNYRSHHDILKIPNEFFYKKKLIAEGFRDGISSISVSGSIGSLEVPKGSVGRAVEFCGLLSKEERNGASPSYFNESEKQMVIKYVKALMKLKKHNVKESDIGVITPYIRQVHMIKQSLAANNLRNIEVGTTEAFQGSEKRIILISTVRAQELLMEHDQKFKLGFVSNKRRFNVALTRAKSKLIIIGNPHVLRSNKHWTKYMDFCRNLGSYFGVEYDVPSIPSLSSHLSNLKLNKNGGSKNTRTRKKKVGN